MTRRITLTFDNGPDAEVTPKVLDVLARRALRTTFFLLGAKLESEPGRELARRALAEGHVLGNHTFSHTKPLGLLPEADAIDEFERTARAIEEVGETRRLFRPYGGGGRQGQHLLRRAVVERMALHGYTCVLWNVVPGDWRDPEGWLARALAAVAAQEWSLVVLHDINAAAMRHLDAFLDGLGDYELRADFPPDCTPIVDGRIVQPIDGLVSD